MLSRLLRLTAATALLHGGTASADSSSASPACKCFPGDACWPSDETWNLFNGTVGGRLISTTPLAQSCHDPHYDRRKCKALKEAWLDPDLHTNSPSSPTSPLFQNLTCTPFTSRKTPCTHGPTVHYTVNAISTTDVTTTVQFAVKHNIRLVIRHTGHDHHGRSLGAGGLAIWTLNLKGTSILDWDDDSYYGQALRIGAGVQASEALDAAKEDDLVVVAGSDPSLGLAGGYIQDGGYSDLSTSFGLAADNALAYEVVSAEGKLLTASRDKNPDLFWALSGGGAGTYGIVTAVTIKAHPDAPVSGASLSISVPVSGPASKRKRKEKEEEDQDTMFGVVDTWHSYLPNIIDAEITARYTITSTTLHIRSITAYNKTPAQLRSILTPFLDAVRKLGVEVHDLDVTDFDSYHGHYAHYFGSMDDDESKTKHIQQQQTIPLTTTHLLPRPILDTPLFTWTTHQLLSKGLTISAVALDVSSHGRNAINSVSPSWRSALLSVDTTLPWSWTWDIASKSSSSASSGFPAEQQKAIQANPRARILLQTEITALLEDVSPGAAAQDPSSQADLLAIKQKYDPDAVLYASSGVGSEEWDVQSDGRMCRAGTQDVVFVGGGEEGERDVVLVGKREKGDGGKDKGKDKRKKARSGRGVKSEL